MQIVESFGKNVFVGKQMIGYIDRQGIFINRQKFADITPEGVISYNQQKIGFVDEDGYIIINIMTRVSLVPIGTPVISTTRRGHLAKPH